jgi:hypothetical protein
MASDPLHDLLQLTRRLSAAILPAVAGPAARGQWSALQRDFAARTGRAEAVAFADAVAQAVACGRFVVTLDAGRPWTDAARRWLLAQADPLLKPVLRSCVARDGSLRAGAAADACCAQIACCLQSAGAARLATLAGPGREAEPDPVYFFERLLSRYDSCTRRRQGVYYTPPAIVGCMVRSIDEVLRAEFSLVDGLADCSTWRDVLPTADLEQLPGLRCPTAPFVRVLDPAMGTGAFLLEVFDLIRRWWTGRRTGRPAVAAQREPDTDSRADDWDAYVVDALLPRLCGQELMLPAVALAQLLMVMRLGGSGFRFGRPGRLHLFLGNTLREPRLGAAPLDADEHPYTVVVGNPPFSGVSANDFPWIRQLLRGRDPAARAVANYLEVDGRPLGERKHWLEDDYVKFLRLAHWLIERASAGVVGFITNHGFLDNVTFRGMRQQLLRTFPRATIIDLHGNTRTGERPPHGGHDESVFAIEQGVAISLWRRPAQRAITPQVQHADLWGAEAEKLQALERAQSLPLTCLAPRTPYYFLGPRHPESETQYARGYSLPELMPVNSTAAVTARDSFVVAMTDAELRERISVLCDAHISDDAVRQRYFTSSRSSRYPPGDTRGWQLAEARQRLRCDPDWRRHIRDCLYRPFDRRRIFWAPWMIDWPRTAVTQHLVAGDNVALVARRQVPASLPCNYVWITDTIALDGLIRSDNRGSESLFPLFLVAEAPACERRANFSADAVARFSDQLQLTWNPAGPGAADDQFTAAELFHYVYATLHAPSYQQRFAAWLRVDFPRVPVPAQRPLFRRLAALGADLAERHLLRAAHTPSVSIRGSASRASVTAGGPRLCGDRIELNSELSIGPVTADVWEFHVGAHQVCHKWLKDRSGRHLTRDDLTTYCQIIAAVENTLALTRKIDEAITACGGWETAFAS